MNKKMVLLDFGASYNQFIIKKLRDFGIYTEMVKSDIKAHELAKDKSIIGIILSGSPSTVYLDHGLSADKAIYDLGIPVLGICYGMQLMAHQLGGKVEAMGFTEKGPKELIVESTNPLISNDTYVFMDHGDHITKLPQGFINYAHTKDNQYSLIINQEKQLYATQFHPEKDESKILETFALDICKAKNDWDLNQYLTYIIQTIKNTVQDKKVLLALSGGFKSTLTAAILYQAIGDQLICVYIDTGLTLNDDPLKLIKEAFSLNIIEIDKSKAFLHNLKDITDPEEKRKIIGNEFMNGFKEISEKLGCIEFLAQGTDFIQILESKNKISGKFVKTHHNIDGLPDNHPFKLIEPLRPLFRHELVQLAKELNLPNNLIHQAPFPGEGLAIRIMGAITQEKLRIVRQSDDILKDEVRKSHLDTANTQFFTVLTDTKSVTNTDFKREYKYALVIRAIITVESMAEVFMQIEFQTLRKSSKRILKEVQGVNRVLLDMTSPKDNIVEWE